MSRRFSTAGSAGLRRSSLPCFPCAVGVLIAFFLSSSCTHLAAQPSAVPCDRLAKDARLKGLSLTASIVAAGPFGPEQQRPESPQRIMPEHCRVQVVAQPTADSHIQVEIWLPAKQSWNGKLLGAGNGGYSSALPLPQMADALRRGYAVVSSDTGHQGDNLSFGAGHPEKIRDWAYRSTHEMALAAKRVVEAYYGKTAEHAYFSGCSTGGQQALSEAQRYPGDFDGIVAGAPGYNRIALNSMFLWSWLVTHPENAAPFPAAKLPLLTSTVLQACDARDGVADGVIADPQSCHPDLGVLRCKDADRSDCLTGSELQQVETLYRGPRDQTTGAQIYPGWPLGSESGWGWYFAGKGEPARLDFWKLWVFNDPQWNPRSFQFARDQARARAVLPYVEATSSDLSAFRQRGGKLLIYHGWADPVVPVEDSIHYDEAVNDESSRSTDTFMRLFLVPGMLHCGGGPGTSLFDPLEALDRWVTTGAAPSRIVASHSTEGKTNRTRPLCPFPQQAVWMGNGTTDDAANFVCATR